MKKYELIKQYPGSDHVGVVVLQKTPNGMYEGWEYNYYKRHVENNPEYWEEVVEKDYEILSYLKKGSTTCTTTKRRGGEFHDEYWEIHKVKRLSDGEIFTLGDRAKTITSKGSHNIRQFRIRQRCTGTDADGDYIYDGIDAIWIDWEENCGGNWLKSTEKVIEKDYEILKTCPIEGTIYSVKRLSDGEVFTVGDKITGYHIDARSIQTIRLCIYTGRIRLEQSGGYTDLMYATKTKQPIFLTHDGKDIFAGDKVWWVNKKTFCSDYFVPTPSVTFFSDINAYFLTKAAAENYVVQKSHSLSIEDFWEFDSWGGSNIAKSKRLKRLVKERLNLKQYETKNHRNF